MSKLETIKRVARRIFGSIFFFILVGLVLGYFISKPAVPQPSIAVVGITGTILGQTYADDVMDLLKQVRDDAQVKGVVLMIDSPGGGVGPTEQIYLDILKLRQQKPVVASVGTMAASGGYYIAVASNYIYAEPTSMVGSIGVFSTLPGNEIVEENIAVSGPFKATGGSLRKFIGWLEIVKRGFSDAVKLQRGERLRLSDEELTTGEIFLGIEGLKYGLIDEIGTQTDAIEKAASLAGIRNYNVVKLSVPQPLFFFFGSAQMEALKAETGLVPKFYYLYFEQE